MKNEVVVVLEDPKDRLEFLNFSQEFVDSHADISSVDIEATYDYPEKGSKFYSLDPSVKDIVFIGVNALTVIAALIPIFLNNYGKKTIRISRSQNSEDILIRGIDGEQAAKILNAANSSIDRSSIKEES